MKKVEITLCNMKKIVFQGSEKQVENLISKIEKDADAGRGPAIMMVSTLDL